MVKLAPIILSCVLLAEPAFHPPYNDWRDLIPPLDVSVDAFDVSVDETDTSGWNELNVTVSAYCLCPKCCGIWSAEHPSRVGTDYVQKTASGTIPEVGRTIAVDPKYIPLGAQVELDGHIYTAEDTGGGVDGAWIDLLCETHEKALEWGLRNKTVRWKK